MNSEDKDGMDLVHPAGNGGHGRSAQPRRLLADVLWDAANERLLPDINSGRTGFMYSCWAAEVACEEQGGDEGKLIKFLTELGCNTNITGFNGYPLGAERQGVRYMWLLLAMHVAEDEGITV